MSWNSFLCEQPDFVVRSIPDNVQFSVQRACLLEGSEVFRDMFACCDKMDFDIVPYNADDQILDINEPSRILTVLLCLLHSPPPPLDLFPSNSEHEKGSTIIPAMPNSVVPLPLLPLMFGLADKYMLSQSLLGILHSHLRAQASLFPLKVYGLATALGLDAIAVKTSKYLLHPPLASYTMEEIQAIPNVESYHKLTKLHAIRVKRLRELLIDEAIFPHGYGACPVHKDQAISLWEQRKKALVYCIEASTDIAAEMATLSGTFQPCQVCHKAYTAAIEMLAYKSRKIPKRVDQIPKD